jgi:hypothetical protein
MKLALCKERISLLKDFVSYWMVRNYIPVAVVLDGKGRPPDG